MSSALPLLAFMLLALPAVVSDLRVRRVPNELSLAVLAGGLLTAALLHPGARALAYAAAASLLGLALWLPFWWVRMLGAGDVKFFAAGAAWLSPALVPPAAVLSALLGGVIALVLLTRRWFRAPHDVSTTTRPPHESLPYVVPMYVGLAFTMLHRVLHHTAPAAVGLVP